MIRRPPRSTRTDTLFPTRRSSDLITHRPLWRMTQGLATNRASFDPGAPTLRIGLPGWRRHVFRSREVATPIRSEEHTSELQSLMRISYAVFCLKKKKHTNKHQTRYPQIQTKSNNSDLTRIK